MTEVSVKAAAIHRRMVTVYGGDCVYKSMTNRVLVLVFVHAVSVWLMTRDEAKQTQ